MEHITLARHERLYLARVRYPTEPAQSDWAEYFGVGRYLYGQWERGEVEIPEEVLEDISIHENEDITDLDRCVILRKRSGKDQRVCAGEMGISRQWFNYMERGERNSQPLFEYWGLT